MFLVDTLCPPYEVDYQVIGPKQALFTSDHALVCQQQLSQRKECTSMYDTCLKVIKIIAHVCCVIFIHIQLILMKNVRLNLKIFH